MGTSASPSQHTFVWALLVLIALLVLVAYGTLSGRPVGSSPCPSTSPPASAEATPTKVATPSPSPGASPTPRPPHACTPIEAVVESIQRIPEEPIHFRLGWPEYLLVAIVLALGIRSLMLSRAESARSPVEIAVDEPEDHSGAIRSVFEDRLAAADVFPPSPVPAIPIQKSLGTAISESGVEQISWIGKVVDAIVGFITPTGGYKVSATGYEDDGKKVVVARLGSALTGRTIAVRTSKADTYQAAATKTAYAIYAALSNSPGPMATVPAWNRWTDKDGASVAAFQDGNRAQTEDRTEDAFKAYRRAIELDPRNAVARYALGSAYEASGTKENAFLAFIEYVELVAQWPQHLEGRYRLSASLAFANTWFDQWTSAKPELRRRLLDVLDGTNTSDAQASSLTETEFQRRAVRQLQVMQRQLRWLAVLGRWLTTGDDLGDYELRLLGLTSGSVRTRYLALTESAKIATRVQIGDASKSELVPIEWQDWQYWLQRIRIARRLSPTGQSIPASKKVLWIRYQAAKARQLPGRVPWLSMGTDWRLRYNVACVLSRAAEGDPDRIDQYTDEAIDQLKLVARDRSPEPPTTQLRSVLQDPDFAPIKDSQRFQSWVATLDVGSSLPDTPEPGPAPQRAAQILASWSRTRTTSWTSRLAEMQSWSGPQLAPLLSWFSQELKVADYLGRWAASPADEAPRQSFWAAISEDEDGNVPDEELPATTPIEPLDSNDVSAGWGIIAAHASDIHSRTMDIIGELTAAAMSSLTIDARWSVQLVLQSRSDWLVIAQNAGQLSPPSNDR